MNKLLLVLLLASGAVGASGPVVKIVNCPTGYLSNGNYCVPMKGSSTYIPKVVNCPIGYLSEGNYCKPLNLTK
jgi:hypothetical protein